MSDPTFNAPNTSTNPLHILGGVLTSQAGFAVFVGVSLSMAFVLISGHNPIAVLAGLILGSLAPSTISDTLTWAVPLVGMTLVAAIPLRAGLINLGGEGQLVIGALCSALCAINLPFEGPFASTLAVLAGMAAGALLAGFAAALEIFARVPILISTLLLNYPIVGLASYLVTSPLRDRSTGLAQTEQIPAASMLMTLTGPLNIGLILVGIVVAVIIFIDRKTVFGLETKVRGSNVRFAVYSGIHDNRKKALLMLAAGAVAGLVGAILVLGSLGRFIDGALVSPAYAWSGLMAALISKGEPIAAVLAGLFFAALQTGGFAIQRDLEVPRVITNMMQAIIVIVFTFRIGIFRR